MGNIGHPKWGGRRIGTPNKVTTDLHALADKLHINPFEILLRFAGNDWQGLGYDSATKTILSKSGELIEVDTIDTAERIVAAKAACDYLFPKRKAVEVTGKDGVDLFQSFGQLMQMAITRKIDETNERASGSAPQLPEKP